MPVVWEQVQGVSRLLVKNKQGGSEMKEKQAETSIKCPNCGFEFPVEGALHDHVLEKVKGEYEEKLKRQSKVFSEKQEETRKELEKKLLEKKGELEEEIRKEEQEKHSMKARELEKKLEDQKKLIEEMQRKAGQGSMQTQGEVQEEALKELLERAFPFDLVEDVAKGARGPTWCRLSGTRGSRSAGRSSGRASAPRLSATPGSTRRRRTSASTGRPWP